MEEVLEEMQEDSEGLGGALKIRHREARRKELHYVAHHGNILHKNNEIA